MKSNDYFPMNSESPQLPPTTPFPISYLIEPTHDSNIINVCIKTVVLYNILNQDISIYIDTIKKLLRCKETSAHHETFK